MKFEKSLIKICPKTWRLPVKYHYKKFRKRLEPELLYLVQILSQGKRAIDIGANEGMYSYALAQTFEKVEAFEPQSWCTDNLTSYSELHGKKINVHHVGLSNLNGLLKLHIPISSGIYSSQITGLGNLTTGLGSFREMKGEQKCVEVSVRKLDDYNFTDVSFIKIDVEGHESRVIAGGRNTIVREKPIILIEIEQRHLDGKCIETVFEQILELGYEGSFLYRDNLIPLAKFSYKENQEPFLDNPSSENYIRNFIFRPVSNGRI
jgi:FkbM family methyltransferase